MLTTNCCQMDQHGLHL